MLLIVCGDIELNPGSGSDRKEQVLYSNIRGLMPIWTSWPWLDRIMMFWFVLSLKSLIAAIYQLELRIPGFGCSQQRLRNSTPGAQGMARYVREGFHSCRQRKLECSCHELKVFRICSRINNFYVHAFYHNPGHDGSHYGCPLDSMARVQSVDDKAVFVFVDDANAHHSEWLKSVSHADRHGRDAPDICNLSGCEQLVRGLSQISGNRLDFVMTVVPDIVDVVVGAPLGTS